MMPGAPSESDMVIQAMTTGMANGSESAYREFFDKYFDRIYRRMLVRARGDEHLSRDLAQAVLLRVTRYVEPMDSEARLVGWLNQIIRSVHIDWLRKNSRQPEVGGISMLEAQTAGDELGENVELLESLEMGLGKLNADESELVRLTYFEDVPHKSIAKKFNTTPKAVESKLARIRAKLRGYILDCLKDHVLI